MGTELRTCQKWPFQSQDHRFAMTWQSLSATTQQHMVCEVPQSGHCSPATIPSLLSACGSIAGPSFPNSALSLSMTSIAHAAVLTL